MSAVGVGTDTATRTVLALSCGDAGAFHRIGTIEPSRLIAVAPTARTSFQYVLAEKRSAMTAVAPRRNIGSSVEAIALAWKNGRQVKATSVPVNPASQLDFSENATSELWVWITPLDG